MQEARIGVIGGSGLYEMEEGLEIIGREEISTPFGDPSDEYVIGKISGETVAFLPRHGKGHRYYPGEINYRANIFGMKMLGVEWIISVSAVGSYREDYRPLDIVVIDQFFDRTTKRKSTFFGDGLVAHIAFSQPICPVLADLIYSVGRDRGISIHKGGTYVNMEGPAFSTLAESLFFKKSGFDLIGMTNLPEAKLAREAEICFATMAMVTDYDCWHPHHEAVTVETIVENLNRNAETAKMLLREIVPAIPKERSCLCADALSSAFITAKDAINPETRKKLSLLVDKYL